MEPIAPTTKLREGVIAGCLVGMAVCDALGLPREGLSPRRASRLFPAADRFHFLFGRGMFSDDTEHACMTAQALLVSGSDRCRFIRSLGWRLRWWLLGLPFGAGKATLKSCLKLWLGFSPRSSGVWSAGNGPASRAAIIGVSVKTNRGRLVVGRAQRYAGGGRTGYSLNLGAPAPSDQLWFVDGEKGSGW